jgi:SSS family solute:Na+ symporter
MIPALGKLQIMSVFFWTFSFAIPIFGVYLIGMLWKVNKIAAWITVLAAYAINFIWTFCPPDLPSYLNANLNLNVYPVTIITILFGVVLNLILPGEPGYIYQLKAAEQKAKAAAQPASA